MTTEVTYILIDGEPTTLEAFAEDNAHDPSLPVWLEHIKALGLGESLTLGGGAMAEVRIARPTTATWWPMFMQSKVSS